MPHAPFGSSSCRAARPHPPKPDLGRLACPGLLRVKLRVVALPSGSDDLEHGAVAGGRTGCVGGHNVVGASVTWLDQADRVRSAGGPGDIDAVLLPLEGERAVLRDKTGGHPEGVFVVFFSDPLAAD